MSWPMGEEEERRRQVRGRIRTRRRSIRIRSGREPRGRGRASHARGPSGLAVGHPRTSQGPPGVRGTAPGETQSRTLGVALGYRRRRGPGAKRGTQAKPQRGRCARPPARGPRCGRRRCPPVSTACFSLRRFLLGVFRRKHRCRWSRKSRLVLIWRKVSFREGNTHVRV